MLSLESIIMLLAIGSLAGLMLGLAGAGGALIMVSLLSLFSGLSVHESVGATLMASTLASFSVFLIYRRYRSIDLKPCIYLALGSIPGVQLGAFMAKLLPENQLGCMLGAILMITSIFLWERGKTGSSGCFRIDGEHGSRYLLGIPMGFTVGTISGLFGASAGVWFLIILLLVFGLPVHKAVGGSALLTSMTACFGTIAHYSYGTLNPLAGMVVGAGAIASGNLSARFANRSTERMLRKVVSILVFSLGMLMLINKLILP